MENNDLLKLPTDKYAVEDKVKVKNFSQKQKAQLTTDQLATYVYDYLSSRRGYIRADGSTYRSPENDAEYLAKIKNCIEKNKPIEMFFLSFCSKYRNKEITNGQIYPDMANLISFSHLLTISKNLSDIYEPGIKFIVGLETDIYKNFGKHTDDEVKKVNDTLNALLKEAEETVGIKDRVELVNVADLVKQAGAPLAKAVELEIENVKKQYESGQIKEELDEWKKFYLSTSSDEMFASEVEAEQYALKQAIFYRAFNNVKYLHGKGIAQNYPDAINATVRGTKFKATIKLMPKESHFPHHGVTVLHQGRWGIAKYSELSSTERYGIPRFKKGFDYPFYYETVSSSLPEHEMNSLKCHTKIVDMADGEKIVLKFSHENEADGTQILAKEISRIQEMRDNQITLVPEIFYTHSTENNVAYATKYIEGETLQDVLFSKDLPLEDFKAILDSFLNKISSEMYSKGIENRPENYLKDEHSSRLEGICENDKWEVNLLNGKALDTPKELAARILENISELDKIITGDFVPTFTHGDLHFRNIIYNQDSKEFKTIDVNGRRPVNTVEAEMSRLLLSFDAHLIRNNLITVKKDGNSAEIIYSEEAKRLIELKKFAFETIMNNPAINKWFSDPDKAKCQIELLEAIHVLGVFHKRKDAEQLTTYALGHSLLNNAYDKIQTVLGAAPRSVDNNKFIAMMINSLIKDPENKALYKKVWLESNAKLSGEYNDFAFVSYKNSWFFKLETKEGQRIVKGLADIPLGIQTLDSKDGVATYDDKVFMQKWQHDNFPSNTAEAIVENYSEKELWNSMFSKKAVQVNNQQYFIKDFLGLGKESKAFQTQTGEVIKVGLQKLDNEFNYSSALAKTSLSKKFPQYYELETSKNYIAMEQIVGNTAEESVKQAVTAQDYTAVIRDVYEAINTESLLYNKYGMFAGQFNLRNVIFGESGVKVIDPFYEGTPDSYIGKQLCRMSAVLPQKLYHTDPESYPMQVKSAESLEDIAKLRYPEKALVQIEETSVGLPKTLESRMKEVFKKYLAGDISRFTLVDMEKDSAELYAMATITEHKLKQGKTAFVFDINGTIEHNGHYDETTVKTINNLINRGIPVAFITGKRKKAAEKILNEMGIDFRKASLYVQNGAACYVNGKMLYQEVLSEKSRQEVLQTLRESQVDIIREDETRVNTLVSDKNAQNEILRKLGSTKDIEIIVAKEGKEIEFLQAGVNKGYALNHFAAENNLSLDDIIRVGNEPNGNDNKILNTRNSVIISNPENISNYFKGIDNVMGGGALHITSNIKIDEEIELKDFEYVETAKLQELSETGQAQAKEFYPAFAVKQRLDEKDSKKLDYKWAICDKGKPVGFVFMYELEDFPGKYNAGMFLLPSYNGKGYGTKILNVLYDFGTTHIEKFSGLRERVAETNKASNNLVKKCGFDSVRVVENDYTLFDENSQPYQVNTTVYEKKFAHEKTAEDKPSSGKIFLISDLGKNYLNNHNQKVINLSGAANNLEAKDEASLVEEAKRNASKTSELLEPSLENTDCYSTYYTSVSKQMTADFRAGKKHGNVRKLYETIFAHTLYDEEGKAYGKKELSQHLKEFKFRSHCFGGLLLAEMEGFLVNDLENMGLKEKDISNLLANVKVYMSSAPLKIEEYPKYFSGIAMINAADSLLEDSRLGGKEVKDNILAFAGFDRKQVADYSDNDPAKWCIPDEEQISHKKLNNMHIYVSNKSNLDFLDGADNRAEKIAEFFREKFHITQENNPKEFELRYEALKSGHGTSLLSAKMRKIALNTFRTITQNGALSNKKEVNRS